jgi:uncharacterized repeat protein (TIGR01451 family)
MRARHSVKAVGLLAALALAVPAQATCDANNRFAFSYGSRPAQTLSYGSTYNYNATNGLGTNRAFSVRITQNGLTSTMVGGQQAPAISDLISGSTVQNTLVVGGILSSRTANITGSTRLMKVVFTFAQPVRTFSMTLHDIDFASNQFRDWIYVEGADADGNVYTPVMTAPAGNGNQTGQPTTATASSVTFQQGGTAARQATGSGESGNSADTGNVVVTFAQPVTEVTFNYGNAPLLGGGDRNTGQQGVGIAGIAFCPMPDVQVTKTSAPVAGALGAYNLPANDVIYTLTVANTGGSPVDASTLTLIDDLPANVEFRNAAFDGTTTLPVKVVSAGGTTLAAGGLAYRQTGQSAYTYTPAAGYDPQVGGVRIIPGGTLGANSTLVLQFRARIK